MPDPASADGPAFVMLGIGPFVRVVVALIKGG
jgi:hypothetical protein